MGDEPGHRSSFESLRASPELDEGTNVDEVEMIDNVPFMLSVSKYSELFFSNLFSKRSSILVTL
jgi:hypothetical protein